MTEYTIPPDNTAPIVLHAGDGLTVSNRGTSRDITVLDDAQETVTGGKSILTTLVDGDETVTHGTADLTTINGGVLRLFDHATADHTRLNGIASGLELTNGSVAKDTVIEIGQLIADATSTVDNVTFVRSANKFATGAVGVANPQNLKGYIAGLAVGDHLQFGSDRPGTSVDITSFEVKNHTLTITYNSGEHATYQLRDMEAGTTFKLATVTASDGNIISLLSVIKTPAPAALAHHHTPSEFDSPLVGVDAHHFHFAPGPFG